MKPEHLITVSSREDLRMWLQEYGKTQKSCWVVVSMKPAKSTLLYLDVVEESLCFGWIDGVKKKYLKISWLRDCLPEANAVHGLN